MTDTSKEAVESFIKAELTEIARSTGLLVSEEDVEACKEAAKIMRALLSERDALRAQLQAARDEALEEEERAHERTIDQRDAMEEAFSSAYELVMQKPMEWSSLYSAPEALRDMGERLTAYRQARESADRVKVKPLDLSTLLKHAFLSGIVAARDTPAHEEISGPDLWLDYDPTGNAAYTRIKAALED